MSESIAESHSGIAERERTRRSQCQHLVFTQFREEHLSAMAQYTCQHTIRDGYNAGMHQLSQSIERCSNSVASRHSSCKHGSALAAPSFLVQVNHHHALRLKPQHGLDKARPDASGTTYHANLLTLYLPCQRLSISLNISLTLEPCSLLPLHQIIDNVLNVRC